MRLMNKMLATVFLLQLVIVFICATLNFQWAENNALAHAETGMTVDEVNQILGSFYQQVLSFWVAYSHMIPISLYVSIEVLKLSQALFINRDESMRDPASGNYAIARNSDLIEELG